MISEKGTLTFGIEAGGKICKIFRVKPLTLGAELEAVDLLDAEYPAELEKTSPARAAVLTTLSYWTHQLEIDGIAPEDLTVGFLLEHLASEDYQLILEALERLRKKCSGDGPEEEKAG